MHQATNGGFGGSYFCTQAQERVRNEEKWKILRKTTFSKSTEKILTGTDIFGPQLN